MFDIYPDQYLQLLKNKTEKLKQLFEHRPIPDIEVFDSPTAHFRMRAEFRIWHTGNKIDYAMFSQSEPREVILIKHFPQACKTISDLMQPLLSRIEGVDCLKTRLFQIDFLSSLSGEVLVTLIYHKKLDDQWREAASDLQSKFSIKIIGRARKQKERLSEDFILEKLTVNHRQYSYQQIENSFTQPNAIVCEKMLAWATQKSQHFSGDLLELYCGNANFSLPLAQNFRRVLATEVSKSSVKSARYNITLNNIKNIDIVRMSSEEIIQAFNKEREFRRLSDISLANYQFSTLFVDPPRAGLDPVTRNFARRFDNIIYVSCNPISMIENLKHLKEYQITHLALFDQFPYTNHMECGLILQKQSRANALYVSA